MSGQNAAYTTAYDALLDAASPRMGKIALIKDDVRLTYGDLLARIENTARHLRRLGIAQGDCFALYGQNTLEHYFCYYAAAKIGAVFVPVNPNLTAAELAYGFDNSDAKILFHDENVAPMAREAIPADKLFPIEILREDLDGEELPPTKVSLEDDFVICYSSGTTGAPKAIVLNHRSQIEAPQSAAQMWGITQADVTLIGLPLGYLYGISTASASNLHQGGTVVVLRRFHPREVLDAIAEHGVSVYQGVPTMYTMMMEYCDQRDLSYDLSGLKVLICSGAPLAQETAARFKGRFGKALTNYYGLSEVYPVFGHNHSETQATPDGAIGRLFPGVTVSLRRADGSECDIDEPGEAFVRGPATMVRYHKAPELTNGVLGADGMFQTGDLVSRNAEGWYFIQGRLKDIIIRGGHNIAPAEVEKSLVEHPSVLEAAVLGVSDRIYGEAPVAFIVLRHGAQVDTESLEAHVKALLSDFKVPRDFYFIDTLPLGKTGKIDKAALKAQAEASALAAIEG